MEFTDVKCPNITGIALAAAVNKKSSTPVHRKRPYQGFAYYTAGTSTYSFLSGKSFTVTAGDLIYLPKGSDYDVQGSADTECYAVNFDIDLSELFEPFVITSKNCGENLARLERVWRIKQNGYYPECISLLARVISDLQKLRADSYISKDARHTVEAAKEYIGERYTSPDVRIGDVAAYCGVSEVYLRRLFAKTEKLSPAKYICTLRLERAAGLLLSGEYSVSDAATLSGYTDMTYFSRQFRARYGVPPSEYRVSIQ